MDDICPNLANRGNNNNISRLNCRDRESLMEKLEDKSISKMVEYVLKNHYPARNDYWSLWQAVIHEYYLIEIGQPPKNVFQLTALIGGLPTIDTVKRSAQRIIHQNKYTKYLPTERVVAENRRIDMQLWREYIQEFKDRDAEDELKPLLYDLDYITNYLSEE